MNRLVLSPWLAAITAGALGGCLLGVAPARAQNRALFDQLREQMVRQEIAGAGVKNQRVLEALRRTPRHEFVPAAEREYAYLDMALPIGQSQTISPPFVVAYMTEAIDPQATDRVLEIGTGSGYQAAVLSPLVQDVFTIEIVEELGRRAAKTLKRLKYGNVHPRIGDGYAGWPEEAPFDKIIVTCSPENVPQALVDQLREEGVLIVPLGERYRQTLYRFRKTKGMLEREALLPTLFVPMTGEAEDRRDVRPDPLHPQLNNGGFEDLLEGDRPEPLVGWHYQRQLSVEHEAPPMGKNFVRFQNEQAGRGAQCLQGLAIDGQTIAEIELTCRVRAQQVRPGQAPQQLPVVAITFYDQNRGTVGDQGLGPWRGSFEWRVESRKLLVPPAAREAIVRLGLLGAVGEIAFDEVQLQVTRRRE